MRQYPPDFLRLLWFIYWHKTNLHGVFFSLGIFLVFNSIMKLISFSITISGESQYCLAMALGNMLFWHFYIQSGSCILLWKVIDTILCIFFFSTDYEYLQLGIAYTCFSSFLSYMYITVSCFVTVPSRYE